MVQYCSAYGCKNEYDKRNNISFHGFPFKRPNILKLWISAIRRDKWQPTKSSKLCSAHFISTDYQNRPGTTTRFLKDDAVPTLFNFPEHLQKKVSNRRILKCLILEEPTENAASTIIPNDVPSTSRQHVSDESSSSSRQFSSNNFVYSPAPKSDTSDKYVDAQSSPIPRTSPTIILLRRRIRTLHQKVRRRDSQIIKMMQLIQQLKKNIEAHIPGVLGPEDLKILVLEPWMGFEPLV